MKDPVRAMQPGPGNADVSIEIYFDRERDSQSELSAEDVENLFKQFLGKASNARGHYQIFVQHIGGDGWTVVSASRADAQKHEASQ